MLIELEGTTVVVPLARPSTLAVGVSAELSETTTTASKLLDLIGALADQGDIPAGCDLLQRAFGADAFAGDRHRVVDVGASGRCEIRGAAGRPGMAGWNPAANTLRRSSRTWGGYPQFQGPTIRSRSSAFPTLVTQGLDRQAVDLLDEFLDHRPESFHQGPGLFELAASGKVFEF
jgi:hypothetical protein